jgi:tryptophan 2,3-dioxygenase
MDPIQEAIEYLESHDGEEQLSYRQVAIIFGVDRTTLLRRHNRRTRSNAEEARQRQLLSPEQEDELVKYIERCTRDSLPPTRSMLKNFATAVTKWEVSDSWVDRFLHCHADKLTTKWTTGIDCERHLADSQRKYKLYFNLLHVRG